MPTFFFVDVVPHGMEEIVELYNDFRSNVVILQDLKTALHAAETELVMLNARLQSENKPVFRNFLLEILFGIAHYNPCKDCHNFV